MSLNLCPLCPSQISSRHKFRLFHVLEAVIEASNSLEEAWEKSFMQLALENMTKTTVCLPSQQISHFWEYRLLPQHPDNGGGAQPSG